MFRRRLVDPGRSLALPRQPLQARHSPRESRGWFWANQLCHHKDRRSCWRGECQFSRAAQQNWEKWFRCRQHRCSHSLKQISTPGRSGSGLPTVIPTQSIINLPRRERQCPDKWLPSTTPRLTWPTRPTLYEMFRGADYLLYTVHGVWGG